MKALKVVIALLIMVNIFFNAKAQENKNTAQIKLITMKQFNEPYDLVFKATMSLMHSERYMIDETDYFTGLIIVSKEVYKKGKADIKEGFILVDKLNDELTEVKLSMYEGNVKPYYTGFYKTIDMNQDPEFYAKWFKHLYAEIQRRKALM